MGPRHYVHVYEDPETSETSGEYDTLAEALCHHGRHGAEIVRNGVTLARAEGSPGFSIPATWKLTDEGLRAAWSATDIDPCRSRPDDNIRAAIFSASDRQPKCSVCREPQFRTPSGMSCRNEHGGAPAAED